MYSKLLVRQRSNQQIIRDTARIFSTTDKTKTPANGNAPKPKPISSSISSSHESFKYESIRNEIMDYWMKNEAASPNGSAIKARYCCFTLHDARQSYLKTDANWHWLDRELSSNYAGETGAVYIYKGAICALELKKKAFVTTTSKPQQQQLENAMLFCTTHIATESEHLAMFEKIVPDGKRTKLIPIWKFAGWTLGFVPTMIGGSKALYVTVEAVESFVEEHFNEQIDPLTREQACPELVKLLTYCCADEVHHREDAANQLLEANESLDSWWIKPWSQVVTIGSKAAAELARRI